MPGDGIFFLLVPQASNLGLSLTPFSHSPTSSPTANSAGSNSYLISPRQRQLPCSRPHRLSPGLLWGSLWKVFLISPLDPEAYTLPRCQKDLLETSSDPVSLSPMASISFSDMDEWVNASFCGLTKSSLAKPSGPHRMAHHTRAEALQEKRTGVAGRVAERALGWESAFWVWCPALLLSGFVVMAKPISKMGMDRRKKKDRQKACWEGSWEGERKREVQGKGLSLVGERRSSLLCIGPQIHPLTLRWLRGYGDKGLMPGHIPLKSRDGL